LSTIDATPSTDPVAARPAINLGLVDIDKQPVSLVTSITECQGRRRQPFANSAGTST
jgi:hypothetical protein